MLLLLASLLLQLLLLPPSFAAAQQQQQAAPAFQPPPASSAATINKGRGGASSGVCMASSGSGSGGNGSGMSSPPPLRVLPKAVIFDLDATLWTPELFEIAGRPFRRVEKSKGEKKAAGGGGGSHTQHRIVDRSGYHIDLFPEARLVLEELATHERWRGVKLGLASRTDCVQDAHELMTLIHITPALKMADLFEYKQIFPGSKRSHFLNLHKETGVAYRDMIFFDDWDLNLIDVRRLGVKGVHTPSGLNLRRWRQGLESFERERLQEMESERR